MSELMNKYSAFANKQNKAMQVITAVVRDSLPFLILVLNIVVTVMANLFQADLQNPFSQGFFVELFTNTLTTMVCYSCFVKYGEKNENLESKSYASNLERWQKMSGEVRKHSSEKFIAYCRKQVELEREEIRSYYVLNHTMLTVEQYEEKYKRLSDDAINKLVARGALRKQEAYYIKRANKARYPKPINPLLILCGVNKTNINDVGRDGVNAATASILTRPIMMFCLTTVLTAFRGSWMGLNDASVLFDMIYSALTIVISSMTGYSAGAAAGRKEHDKIKGRIFFLERYLAEEGKAEEVKADVVIAEQ
jgi:hypothetical protein